MREAGNTLVVIEATSFPCSQTPWLIDLGTRWRAMRRSKSSLSYTFPFFRHRLSGFTVYYHVLAKDWVSPRGPEFMLPRPPLFVRHGFRPGA